MRSWCWHLKAAIDHTKMNKCVWTPINFHLQKQDAGYGFLPTLSIEQSNLQNNTSQTEQTHKERPEATSLSQWVGKGEASNVGSGLDRAAQTAPPSDLWSAFRQAWKEEWAWRPQRVSEWAQKELEVEQRTNLTQRKIACGQVHNTELMWTVLLQGWVGQDPGQMQPQSNRRLAEDSVSTPHCSKQWLLVYLHLLQPWSSGSPEMLLLIFYMVNLFLNFFTEFKGAVW